MWVVCADKYRFLAVCVMGGGLFADVVSFSQAFYESKLNLFLWFKEKYLFTSYGLGMTLPGA